MRGTRVTAQNAPAVFDKIQKILKTKESLVSFQIPTRSIRKVNQAIHLLRNNDNVWFKNKIGTLISIEKEHRFPCISFPKKQRDILWKSKLSENTNLNDLERRHRFLKDVELFIGVCKFISIYTNDKVIIKPHGIFIEQGVHPNERRYITAIYW